MNLQLHLNGVYLTSQTHKFRFLNSPKVKAYSAFLQKNQDVLIDQPCLTGESESDKNCVTFKSVTFEKFLIFMENTIGIIPNTFHDFQKNFKSDTFENYKSFVSVEVQSRSM